MIALCMLLALVPTTAFAVEGEYTAPSDWVTGTFDGDDSITITYTIPADADYEKINFPIFNFENNGFPIYDEQGKSLGTWTWVPGDSADITIQVVDLSGKYSYQASSLWVGTKELNPDNPREVVNRSYNPALYSLIRIQQWGASDNRDVEEKLTDEALGALLRENGWENGIEDLDEYYCNYYDVSDLEQLPDATLESLFSGRWNGTFTGMYDAIGAKETNAAVIQQGWKNLYNNLFTIDGTGLLRYTSGSDALSQLDEKFASSVASSGVTTHIEIDALKTTNCYQNHDIYMGLSFAMVQKGSEDPDKISEPGIDKKVQTGTDEEGNPIWGDVDTAAAGTNVNFKLESTVPEDLLNYLNPDPVDPPEINGEPQGDATEGDVPEGRGEYQLTFHDQMDDAFINPDGFEVKIGDTTLTEGQYTLTQTDLADGCDFEITIDLVALYGSVIDQDDLGVTPITVTYTATLAEGTTAGNYVNEAWVHYPDADSEHDTVTVKTFDITVFKYDQATATGEGDSWTAKGLPGAIFTLYSDEDCTVIVDTATSDNDGYATFTGLDAGTYYLKETAAPEGYVKSDKALEVTITVDTADNTVSVSFANSLIPHTGGMGTTLFSIVGGVLIAMAGTIFVISRRKRRA